MSAASIIFAGFGGQGVLLMGYVMALAAMHSGKNVTYLPAYGAEVRGGTANCTVVISDEEIASPVAGTPDYLVVMNNPSMVRFGNAVRPGGAILANADLVEDTSGRPEVREYRLAVSTLAHELGEARSANMVMLGALVELSGLVELTVVQESLAATALGRKPEVLELNRRALSLGAERMREILEEEKGK